MTAASARYGRGTAGLATAAVAALSASALAGLVWFGADQVLGRAASPGGLLGDLGLAPAQVDLGRTAAHHATPARPSAPAPPPVRTGGLTLAATSQGAAPLGPVTTPGVPPTTAGSGTPGPGSGTGAGNGNGNGNGQGGGTGGGQPAGGTDGGGRGNGRGPLHGTGGVAQAPGQRWAEQLALVRPADLAAALAADLPGVGSMPAAGSPRSDRAVASAQNRLAWALARAELKGRVTTAAAGTASTGPATTTGDVTTGDGTTAPPQAHRTASQPPTSHPTAHPQVTVVRGHATPPGQASAPGHGHGHAPAAASTPHAGTGGGSYGHGQGDYTGKHRRG